MNKEELESLVSKYRKEYYVDGSSSISDEEFDRIEDELRDRFSESSLLKTIGSDTSSRKIHHHMVMGSQDKFNTKEGLHNWLVSERIEFPVHVQNKMDGISVELMYEDGRLVTALTRGDGEFGEDITQSVLVMGVPRLILKDETLSVRGEIVMNKQTFSERYADKFKNSRNLCAGAVKNKNGLDVCRDIDVVCYDVFDPSNEDRFTTWTQKVEFLRYCMFKTSPDVILRSEEEINKYRDSFDRSSYPYDIDGLVIKQDLIDKNDLTSLRPSKQHAYKWEDEHYHTLLRDVEWHRTGSTYTPVAILEPVEIDGTTVSRASLANPLLIRDLGIKVNDMVAVSKRGMIIPKIESVVCHTEFSRDIIQPSVCELCGSPLEIVDSALRCTNDDCIGNIEHRISKWIEMTGCKGIGDEMQKWLVSSGYVREINTLYNEEVIRSACMSYGNLSMNKGFVDLYSRKTMTLEKFFAGWDIDGIGDKMIGRLVESGYDTVDKILGICGWNSKTESLDGNVIDVSGVRDWGRIRSDGFISGLKKHCHNMYELLSVISIESKSVKNVLEGMHVCVTGKLIGFSRKGIEDLIMSNGGVIDSGVTKNTSILVTNDSSSGSSKTVSAKKYGTKIVSEEDLVNMIRG